MFGLIVGVGAEVGVLVQQVQPPKNGIHEVPDGQYPEEQTLLSNVLHVGFVGVAVGFFVGVAVGFGLQVPPSLSISEHPQAQLGLQ